MRDLTRGAVDEDRLRGQEPNPLNLKRLGSVVWWPNKDNIKKTAGFAWGVTLDVVKPIGKFFQEVVEPTFSTATNSLSYAFQVFLATMVALTLFFELATWARIAIALITATTNLILITKAFSPKFFLTEKQEDSEEQGAEEEKQEKSLTYTLVYGALKPPLMMATSIGAMSIGLSSWYAYVRVLSLNPLLAVIPTYGSFRGAYSFEIKKAGENVDSLLSIFFGEKKFNPVAFILTMLLSPLGVVGDAAFTAWFTNAALEKIFGYFLESEYGSWLAIGLAGMVGLCGFVAGALTSASGIYFGLDDWRSSFSFNREFTPLRLLVFSALLGLSVVEAASTILGFTAAELVMLADFGLIASASEAPFWVKALATGGATSSMVNYVSFFIGPSVLSVLPLKENEAEDGEKDGLLQGPEKV
jgi:hypothetical protein